MGHAAEGREDAIVGRDISTQGQDGSCDADRRVKTKGNQPLQMKFPRRPQSGMGKMAVQRVHCTCTRHWEAEGGGWREWGGNQD